MTKPLTEIEKRAVLKEAQKRFGAPAAQQEAKLDLRQQERTHAFMKALHSHQLAFASDPSRRKAALCTRRAGKSTVACFMMIKAALDYDGCLVPYITITRENAQKMMWKELKHLNRRFSFGMEFNETSLTAVFPNGSSIWLMGAKHKDDIERLRGPKYPLAVLDEAASFGPHIEALLLEVLAPALRDYLGTMVMIGTPGPIPAGLFYEVTSGLRKNWSVHKWSLADNPFLPAEARDLEKIKEDEGMDETVPRFQREYLGLWSTDDNNIIYRFNYARNTYTVLPEDDYYFNLGVDLGFDDDTAFVVGAYSHHSPNFYIIDTFKAPKMDITSVALKIQELEQKYPFTRKVVDSGALGKMIVAELTSRHGLTLEPAEKKDKLGHIEQFNSDLLMGRILVPETAKDLIDEYTTLPWAEGRREEHPAYANHLADAALYAWRDSRHYAGVARSVDPRTREQIRDDEEEERMMRKHSSQEHWYDLN